MSHWRTVCAAVAISAAIVFPALAQTTGAAPPPAAAGIGLTADHKRMIYREVGGEARVEKMPNGQPPSIGVEIPNSMMLNAMPLALKDQIGVLRDFKFAKLSDEAIVIVDPAKRQVVDIVTKEDGAQ